jgi:hypothetical protein
LPERIQDAFGNDVTYFTDTVTTSFADTHEKSCVTSLYVNISEKCLLRIKTLV